jgi:CubicO group peptidase (beta-lactamase class C family)
MNYLVSRRRFLAHLAGMAGAALVVGGCALAARGQAGSASSGSITAPQAAQAAQRADAMLAGQVAARQFRGSVLVARAGQVLFSEGYDWADADDRIANSPQTRFLIGSITKQFTAMAILILQERGALRVQDPLSVHLSNCPPSWGAITLQHLLTMTSGIPDYVNFPSYPSWMQQQLSVDQVIATFRDRPLDFAPGTRWEYSNSNYVLLGDVVQRASGMGWDEFLARCILEPLRLGDTGVATQPSSHLAVGYTSWAQPAAFERNAFGSGAMYSTVFDLARWDQEVTGANPTLVSRSTLQQMFTPYVPIDPAAGAQSTSYGYGWFIGYEGSRREIEHTGEISGCVSANQLYPDDRLTVIILSNLDADAGIRQLSLSLAGIFLGYADCYRYSDPCSEL